MRRFLLVLVLVAAALVGPSMPQASACSCATYDVRERLAEVDGAFVGALVARHDPPVGGVFSSADQIRYTFRVERGVKGDIPSETIDVWASSSGASCGLETPVGERAGLLLERDGDRWTSNLCAQADPDVLIRAGRPLPPPDGRAPPAVLVGTTHGPGRMLSLDGSGRVVAYGPGHGIVTDIAFCSGAPLLAEAYTAPTPETYAAPGVALRSTTDLNVIWERPLTPDADGYTAVSDVACHPAGGDNADVLAITIQEVSTETATRHEARILAFGRDGDPRPLWQGEATGGTFSSDGRAAYLTTGPDGRNLVEIDLRDPANAVVHPRANVPAGLGPLTVSPTGRHLAGATTHQSWTGTGSPPPTTAVVVDLADSPPKVVETALGPYGAYGTALWAGDRVVFAPLWSDQHPVRLFDTTLAEIRSWSGFAASRTTVVGDHLVGLNGPKVVTAPVATGPATPWADLESGIPGTLAAYPEGAPIGEPAPTTTTTAPPAPVPSVTPQESGEQAIASLPGQGDGGMGGRPLLAGGAGAALLGAAAVVLIRRRRLPQLPPL